jgi:hypothetical protein
MFCVPLRINAALFQSVPPITQYREKHAAPLQQAGQPYFSLIFNVCRYGSLDIPAEPVSSWAIRAFQALDWPHSIALESWMAAVRSGSQTGEKGGA